MLAVAAQFLAENCAMLRSPQQPQPLAYQQHLVQSSGLQLLHQAFNGFNEIVNVDACWEASRSKLLHLQTEWQARGLYGAYAFKLVVQHRVQVAWESMVPDQFNRFYRFLFHICREPGKRNLQVEQAVAAWRLLLRGRFRLLERWCDFVSNSCCLVISEDTWRQVLDFSRTVHEDLSNYDAGAAWAVLLDEFVEHVRCQRPSTRQSSSDLDLSCSSFQSVSMSPVAPSCGSKRRMPDVDQVAKQLHNMPLSHVEDDPCLELLPLKRICSQLAPALAGYPAASCLVPMHVPGVITSQRRVVRTKRSAVSDMLHATVSEALGFSDVLAYVQCLGNGNLVDKW